jgi:hypothetical protein
MREVAQEGFYSLSVLAEIVDTKPGLALRKLSKGQAFAHTWMDITVAPATQAYEM